METKKQNDEDQARKQANYNQLLLSLEIGEILMGKTCKIHGTELTDIHKLGDDYQCPDCFLQVQELQMVREQKRCCTYHNEELKDLFNDSHYLCESCCMEAMDQYPRFGTLEEYEQEMEGSL